MTQRDLSFLDEEQSAQYPRFMFWGLIAVLGALQAWAHRNEVSPDGISYIEMATAARSGWHALVNGYWSPLYPGLLNVGFRLFNPSPYWEFTFVHFVNFVVYLADLFCFEIFLKELLEVRRAERASKGDPRPVPEKTLKIWAYLLFLWSTQFWLGPSMVNPDILVAGLAYLETALLLRICRGKGSLLLFGALGAMLGVAYLAKAAMFPLASVFFLSGFALFRSSRRSFSDVIVSTTLALMMFGLVAGPLVVAISREKQRLTFGEAGKLNYARYVGGAPMMNWQGEPAGTGTPTHPTRRISIDPIIYEFAQPVGGSYPPWHDPSYWYEGIRGHFSLRGQLWVLFRSANLYLKLFSRSGALYVVFLALILQVRKGGKWDWGERRIWLVWLPSLAALAMFALVLVEQRYVSPFVLMLLVWVLSSARISAQEQETFRKGTDPVVTLALSLAIAWPVVRDLRETWANRPYEQWQAAVALREMGIPRGAQLGTIGSGAGAYWAHLAGVRVIAEIPDEEQKSLLVANSAKEQEALEKFAEVGAKAVVTKNLAVAHSMQGWQPLGQTQYFIWKPEN